MKRVAILGSTGSIGTSCLQVLAALSDRLQPVALTAHSNWQRLAEQCRALTTPNHTQSGNRGDPPERNPAALRAVIANAELKSVIPPDAFPETTELLFGPEQIERIAAADDVDIVIGGIVGAAGLRGTWAAVESGKTVGIANKETLVVAGPLVMQLAQRSSAVLIPVDSEHSAIFQALQTGQPASPRDAGLPRDAARGLEEVQRIVLTASGGPFRGWDAARLKEVTPEMALAHPTWEMGPKITVDSATLMNKALEIIEARWLFNIPPDRIDVVIHPQSIVHSFVEFVDGSVMAQLSPPDMKLPIQYALTYPERRDGPAPRMDWTSPWTLEFEPPDLDAFPALRLGYEVAERGGTCGAVLNAANEAAVQRFLDGDLPFTSIPQACRAVLDAHNFDMTPTLSELMRLDAWARKEAYQWT